MKTSWSLKVITILLLIYSFSLTAGELGPVWGEKGVWYKAHLTWYQSYPAEGSAEYVKYSGGEYQGAFAFVNHQKSAEWVRENNIVAVHSEHGKWLRLKDLQLRLDPEDEESEIIGTVYDICSDLDCNGCCSRNASESGYLIDLEIHTLRRMGFTKDSYPEYIYFKIYENERERERRESREQRREERELRREN